MAAYQDNTPLIPLTRGVDDGVPRAVSRTFIDRMADQQRRQAMNAAWQAYLGQLPPSLVPEPGEPDPNVNINRIAPIVDTNVAWLFGASLGIEIDPTQELLAMPPEDSPAESAGMNGMNGANGAEPDAAADAILAQHHLPDSDANSNADTDAASGDIGALTLADKEPTNPQVQAAQDYLDGCWGDEDDRMTLLAKLATNGGNCGHLFAKILPPDTQSGRQFPRLVVLDPQNVTMQTDPEDCDTVTAYTICYDAETDDGTVIEKRQVIARQANGAGTADDTWLITNYARGGAGGNWTQLGEPTVWQHPWAPIIDGPNLPAPNQRWGFSDVTPNLIQLNKAINFVASNINAIGYSHGHPWIWASGTNAQLVKTAPGHIISLPHPQAVLGALVAHGDIAGLMQFEADLRADMDEQSKVPAVATGRMAELPRGQQSGVMIRLLHTPLMFRIKFKQRTYGKFIREACARMLALGGFGDGTDLGGIATILHWQDPLPVDDLQQAQAALAWMQMGVSQDTLQEKGGFNPDVERRKNDEANARQLKGFAQGTDMPPTPASPSLPATPPDASQQSPDAAQSPATSQQPAMTPVAPSGTPVPVKKARGNRKPPPVNHPKAMAMRQAMKQASGKAL